MMLTSGQHIVRIAFRPGPAQNVPTVVEYTIDIAERERLAHDAQTTEQGAYAVIDESGATRTLFVHFDDVLYIDYPT